MSSALSPGTPSVPAGTLRALFHDSLRDYLRAHGTGWGNALRLYTGYGISLGSKLVAPWRFECVGAHIPGASNLVVSVGRVRFNVRPGTNDLDLLLHHESRTLGWFRPKPGDVVVDVGAHIGRYTVMAAPVAGIVVAVEPDPHNFAILRENVLLNRFANVRLHALALSDRQGPRGLRLAKATNRGTSTLEFPSPSIAEGERVEIAEVACETLDALMAKHGIGAVDWLKVDVEGHEAAVLRGSARTLRATQNVILEVTHGHEAECLRLLDAAGFDIVDEEPGAPTANWLLRRRGFER